MTVDVTVVADIWQGVTKRRITRSGESFFDTGSSLQSAVMLALLEAEFDVRVSLGQFLLDPSFDGLVRRLNDAQGKDPEGLLIALRVEANSKIPLVLIHPHSGTALSYLSLVERIESRPVFGVMARGFDTSAPLLDDLDQMATVYAREIHNASIGPLVLGGWSLGAILAFEVAAKLERMGGFVAGLLMIDPKLDQVDRKEFEAPLWWRIAHAWRIEVHPDALRALDQSSQMHSILADGIKQHRVPVGFTVEMLVRRADIQAANAKALVHYRSTAHFDGDCSLFLAADELDRNALDYWQKRVSGNVDETIAPGSHGSLLMKPHVKSLALAVSVALAKRGRTNGAV